MGIFDLIKNVAVGTAKLALKAETKIGDATIGIGKAGFKMGTSKPFDESTKFGKFGNYASDPIGRYTNTAKSMTTGLVKDQDTKLVFDKKSESIKETKGGYKLSGKGWAAIAGMTAFTGFNGAADTFASANQGQAPDQISPMTPKMDDAGASGDLVFALYKNRRG